MKLSQYGYDFSPEMLAKYPADNRDESRLMVINRATGTIEHRIFKDLVDFMISGPVMIQALEGENAILTNRELMGATDPKKAEKGTIRADFADSIDANAVHGSDAAETAAVEIAFFFPGMNVYSR